MKTIRSQLRSLFALQTPDDNLSILLSAGFELSKRENDLLFEAIAAVVAGVMPKEPSSEESSNSLENQPCAGTRARRSLRSGKSDRSTLPGTREFYTPELKPSPDPCINNLDINSPDQKGFNKSAVPEYNAQVGSRRSRAVFTRRKRGRPSASEASRYETRREVKRRFAVPARYQNGVSSDEN
eukprot:781460-Amorphochlora_amoeboformis.AAC.1